MTGEDWKTAVLDSLASTCMDAPVTMPPSDILAKVIAWHVGVTEALAQPLHPITADDVTDEMVVAFRDGDDGSPFEDISKCLAAVVNAWIKQRSNTK